MFGKIGEAHSIMVERLTPAIPDKSLATIRSRFINIYKPGATIHHLTDNLTATIKGGAIYRNLDSFDVVVFNVTHGDLTKPVLNEGNSGLWKLESIREARQIIEQLS